jgi:GAF domain-containing protein
VTHDRLRAAVSAGTMASEKEHRALLASIVDVARAIFRARASSIALYDEDTDELVFEAVSGEGSDTLPGARFPATQGISGWVFGSGQPLVLEDVGADPRFARDVAERTGYVPRGLMAFPLMRDGEARGVLSVLDRPRDARFTLAEMELLGLFATQAAVALEVVRSVRRARTALEGEDEATRALAHIAEALDGLEGRRREAAARMLAALADLLAERA